MQWNKGRVGTRMANNNKNPSQIRKMNMYNQCLLDTQCMNTINVSFLRQLQKNKIFIYTHTSIRVELWNNSTVEQFNSNPSQVFSNNISQNLKVQNCN